MNERPTLQTTKSGRFVFPLKPVVNTNKLRMKLVVVRARATNAELKLDHEKVTYYRGQIDLLKDLIQEAEG